LREEHPASLCNGGEKNHVLGDRREVVVVRFNAPAELSQTGRYLATEIAIAEED
jgi:hypothetical protein